MGFEKENSGMGEGGEPLVSIIVPVYNAEAYLARCINSVMNQEYTNFELLLVNDGSSDGSAALCDSFAQRDARVRVIHKENTGVSDSRNRALAEAKGEYIQFLDSDDWLTPEATKLFVRSAENSGCDMVIADFYRVAGENLSHKGDIEKEGLLTRQEFAAQMMENPADFYYGVLWNKLFKRSIIEKYRLRMDPEISWCEDFIFNLEYIRHCRSIYALQAPVYYYVRTKGSLVSSQGSSINNTIRMKLNVFEYYNQFYKEIYDEESYDDIRLHVYKFFLMAARDGFVGPSILPGSVKLGEERQSFALPEAVEEDGVAMDFYRYRKLWERYCEVVAIKNGLTLGEVLVLLYLKQSFVVTEIGQLSDLIGITKRSVGAALQKLEKRQMLRREPIKVVREAKRAAKQKQETKAAKRGGWRFELLPEAEPVLRDLELAEKDFEAVRFRRFSEEEKKTYLELTEKLHGNVKDILRDRIVGEG